MAAGNTGEYLDTAADSTCTWLSRDGGFSWEDVADYAAIYEFGDHGSILLTARYQVSNSEMGRQAQGPPARASPACCFLRVVVSPMRASVTLQHQQQQQQHLSGLVAACCIMFADMS